MNASLITNKNILKTNRLKTDGWVGVDPCVRGQNKTVESGHSEPTDQRDTRVIYTGPTYWASAADPKGTVCWRHENLNLLVRH